MTSKFQIRPFPHDKLGKFISILVKINNGDTVEINYQDLKIVSMNGQICFYYESEDGDIVMPIARESTIKSIFEKEK